MCFSSVATRLWRVLRYPHVPNGPQGRGYIMQALPIIEDDFGHDVKLRDTNRDGAPSCSEGYRFERENRFARFVHRFNLFLETRGGYGRAQASIAIYDNR